jgi:hypothetical protein
MRTALAATNTDSQLVHHWNTKLQPAILRQWKTLLPLFMLPFLFA